MPTLRLILAHDLEYCEAQEASVTAAVSTV